MDRSAADAGAVLSALDVSDLLDTLEAADVRTTIAGLEDLLAALRPASIVRERLASVDGVTLKAALIMRAQRRHSEPVRR